MGLAPLNKRHQDVVASVIIPCECSLTLSQRKLHWAAIGSPWETRQQSMCSVAWGQNHSQNGRVPQFSCGYLWPSSSPRTPSGKLCPKGKFKLTNMALSLNIN